MSCTADSGTRTTGADCLICCYGNQKRLNARYDMFIGDIICVVCVDVCVHECDQFIGTSLMWSPVGPV